MKNTNRNAIEYWLSYNQEIGFTFGKKFTRLAEIYLSYFHVYIRQLPHCTGTEHVHEQTIQI